MKARLVCLGLVGCALAVGVSLWLWRPWAAARPEYAEPPFAAMGSARPPLMIEREFPRSGSRQEQLAWRKQALAVVEYRSKGGVIARASAPEREAVLAEHKQKYVRARELAEAVLADDPTALAARFVLACVLYRAEQNLPAALYEVRQLRYRLEAADAADADAREWYVRVLDLEEEMLGYLNRREEQLQALTCLERVYGPVPWLKVFPLIKLGRIAEAEELLDALEKGGGHPMKVLNSRIMVAEHRRDREGMYRAGKEMTTRIPNSPVLQSNFALACQGVFRFDEAEQAYKKATKGAFPNFNGSAHFYLAQLHLQQGRFPQAWQALHHGQRQRAARGQSRPHTLGQDQATPIRGAAHVLIALGYGEAAERYARLAEENPNRLGSTTTTETEQAYNNGLTLWLALRTRVELRREEEALTTGTARLWPDLARHGLELEAWALRRRLVKLLADEKFLAETFRPYLRDANSNGVWFNTLALELLPDGVAAEAVRRARQAEAHEAAGPYFDVLEARLALRRGDTRTALAKAELALERLPTTHERLLRALVAAVGAEAARRLGERDRCLDLSQQTLRDFPQAFRLYGLTIPVRIEHDGDGLSRRLAEHLRRSCRFREDAAGFAIHVRREGSKLVVRLQHRDGSTHVECAEAVKGDEAAAVAAAFRRFQARLTSPGLDLTAIEINGVARVPQ